HLCTPLGGAAGARGMAPPGADRMLTRLTVSPRETEGGTTMPSYHVHLSYGSKGRQGGGAGGFQRYLARLDLAEGFRRYLTREAGHGKDDLVAYGEANLPAWARDGAHFWTAAEQRERAKGPVFWHLQVALPRELGPDERQELADDLREVMV